MSDEGPSHETLRKLFEMLPSMKQGMIKRKLQGRGKPAARLRPTKVCTVCGVLFENQILPVDDDTPLLQDPCPECYSKLKAGETAFIHGKDYAFVRITDSSNFAGAIMHISAGDMAEIKVRLMMTKEPKDETKHS